MRDFTVEELDSEIEEMYGPEFYFELYDDEVSKVTEFGMAEYVDSESDYDEGRQSRMVIFKIGDRLFRKSGFYDSWGEYSGWDGDLEEVRGFEITITRYEAI